MGENRMWRAENFNWTLAILAVHCFQLERADRTTTSSIVKDCRVQLSFFPFHPFAKENSICETIIDNIF